MPREPRRERRPHRRAQFGAPLPRLDGIAKVTGAARYAADHRPGGMLYGVIVGAPVAAGRLRSLDASAALAVPGVTHVLTHETFPRLARAPVPPASSSRMPLQDDEVRHEGEPIGLVLADSLEAAEYAATLVHADVESAAFVAHPAGEREGAVMPRESNYLFFGYVDAEHGDVDAGLGAAAVRHEATYVQPSRHHNPIEPSATLAEWDGGTLTLIDATQWVYGVRMAVAAALELAPGQIRVRSPHTGGGFGCKGFVWPQQIIAAAAARAVERPVRVALTRAQMYSIAAYQPQLVQTVTLGAGQDGRLQAIDHESINVTSVTDDFVEYATAASQTSYAAPAIRLRQRVQRANVNLPNPMRAPVEGCGMWALGSAMNELAERLGTDPIQLRLANYAETEPIEREAVVLEEAPRVLRGRRARVRLARAPERARARRGVAGRPGHVRLRDGVLPCAVDGACPASRGRRRGPPGRLPGHRHRHADGPSAGCRRCARARARDGRLRDGGHEPPRGGRDGRLVLDDGRRRRGDGRGRGRARAAERAIRPCPRERSGRRRARDRDERRRVGRSWSAKASSRPTATRRMRSTPSARCSSRSASIPSSGSCGCVAPSAATASGGSSIPVPPGRR